MEMSKLPQSIKVISACMSPENQLLLAGETVNTVRKATSQATVKHLTEDLKAFAEMRLGGCWQVMVVEGSYWITQTFLPNMSFQFSLNDQAYLFWQTSEDAVRVKVQ
ncbi:hypothetical protein CRM22_003720 [Opisthorchis felineus]|uniref:Dynein light chain n=1 Tax=Opisthorchis felineus TaxID=147828 RepID=A0A4S2LZY6_OPIFE|nr:hypothetical protein CRM22_003720 [Opisthorchis felineus]